MNNMLSPFDFTWQEIKEIAISLAVMTFVFAYPEILTSPVFILNSLLGVGIAFFGHEMAHRFVARKRGFYSAYRMWPQGLLFAIVLTLVTNGNFVFAAPGAVIFAGYWMFRNPTIDDIGIIGIAGVVFNIAAMYFSLSLYFWTGFPLFSFIGTINGWLAIFNLVPFGPLDGRKVMDWNRKIWLAALALAVTGFAMLLFF
jgi:Zn-dependent protease